MPPASLRFSCQMPYETNASYLTLFSASLIVFFLSFKKNPSSLCSVPPTTQNKRYIHLPRLAVAETPRRNSWVLFPTDPAAEHNAIHATGRKQAKRPLRWPNNVENVWYFLRMESTVLDRCLCAVSAEVHIYFIIFFPLHWFESFLSEQGVNVGCGEAAPLNWSLFRLRYILQSWLLPPVRTCGALKWNHVLNRPQAVV